uniref:J domain-containing protein n=1 Tax=Gongylonema pulchrum TaxID=637853 RepID=A0A183EJF3_9BILA
LNRAYSVLSDKQKRAVYDETGIIGDDVEISSDDVDLVAWGRMMFKKVTKQDIDQFIQEYRDSGEERSAVKEAYINHNGDMRKILDTVLGVTYEDEERLRSMINEMIEAGELKATRKFLAEPEKRKSRRIRAAKREAESKEGEGALVELIQNRQKQKLASLDAFCDSLAQKYAKKPRRAKK